MGKEVTEKILGSKGLSKSEIKDYIKRFRAVRKAVNEDLAEENHELFYDTKTGYRFFYQEWAQADSFEDPKGLIFGLHGFALHSDYLAPIADFFCPKGFRFIALDYRGHGRTGGMMGGMMGLVQDLDEILEDTYNLIVKFQNNYPDIPLLLVGEDLGAVLAILLLKDYPDLSIEKLILLSPLVKIKLSIPMKLIRGPFWLVNKLFKIKSNIDLPDYFIKSSHTYYEEFNNYYTSDALMLNEIALTTLGQYLESNMFLKIHVKKMNIPVLIAQGTGDLFADPMGSQNLFDWWPHDEKKIRLYQNAHHYLLYDEYAKEIWTLMKDFLLDL